MILKFTIARAVGEGKNALCILHTVCAHALCVGTT